MWTKIVSDQHQGIKAPSSEYSIRTICDEVKGPIFITANLLPQKSAKKTIKYNLLFLITISLDREIGKKNITLSLYVTQNCK